MPYEYRDKVFLRKDIILKLAEYGIMNQSKLLSYCALNLAKHKELLNDLEEKEIIEKKIIHRGNQKIINYNVTIKGLDFCRKILEPYEQMFPRKNKAGNNVN